MAVHPNASFLSNYYGDIDNAYVPVIQQEKDTMFPMSHFFATSLLIKKALAVTNAYDILIFLALFSRLASLFIFLLIGKELTGSYRRTIVGLAFFVFAPRLIGAGSLTQGFKFLVGAPVFLAWLWSFLKYEKQNTKAYLLLNIVFFLTALITEEWIAFFLMLFYAIWAVIKLRNRFSIYFLDVFYSLLTALAVVAIYWKERQMALSNNNAYLSFMPYVFRQFYLAEYFWIIIIIIAAIVFCFWLARKVQLQSRTARGLVYGLVVLSALRIFSPTLWPVFKSYPGTFLYFPAVLPFLILFIKKIIQAPALTKNNLIILLLLIISLFFTLAPLFGLQMDSYSRWGPFFVPLLIFSVWSDVKKIKSFIIKTIMMVIIPLTISLLGIYQMYGYVNQTHSPTGASSLLWLTILILAAVYVLSPKSNRIVDKKSV